MAQISVDELSSLALACGFSHAAPLEPAALLPRPEVRDMCAADKCHAFGRNWTCPPNCGSLEECAQALRQYPAAVLAQTVGSLEDSFDIEGIEELNQAHQANFSQLADALRARGVECLCLSAGGCRICASCAYPEPCRFPERAHSSIEAYGLLVNEVCQAAGLPYYHGKDTMTYSALFLFRPGQV